jgi:hypothetical protein
LKKRRKYNLCERVEKPVKMDNGHDVRAQAAERQRRFKVRQRAGIMVVPVEVDWRVLDLLIRMGWVKEEQASSPLLVGQAIAGRLAKSARA